MKFKVKDVDIATGDTKIALVNEIDAAKMDVHSGDRIVVRRGKRSAVAVVNIGESSKVVKPGIIGLFEEVLDALNAENNDNVDVKLGKKPESLDFIRKKLDGRELNASEIKEIVKDIVSDSLTYIELTSYVVANYARGMSRREILDLTKAMVDTGVKINPHRRPVADLHSIGGIPGNRITMVVVPIVAAAGVVFPKTSSRAITSPSGTADTMEVLAPVVAGKKRLAKILKDVGAFMVWGGAINLAPADDKIIKVEHPLQIDAEGQMLASIIAKKASVGSTHLLLELPIGKHAKLKTRKDANHLKNQFEFLCKKLNIKLEIVFARGELPIGRGIGPVLEARDVLWVLQNDECGPKDLRNKSIDYSGKLLELVGKAKKGKGNAMAKKLLDSGAAYRKMIEIIQAQGGKVVAPGQLKPARFSHDVRAGSSGRVSKISIHHIARMARMAGSPRDAGAGVYIHKMMGEKVKKGDLLYTVYAEGINSLKDALRECNGSCIIIN